MPLRRFLVLAAVVSFTATTASTPISRVDGSHFAPNGPVDLAEIKGGEHVRYGQLSRRGSRIAMTATGEAQTAEAREFPSAFGFRDEEPGAPAGLVTHGEGNGFEIVVPADGRDGVLRVYTGVFKGWALVTAQVEGGPAAYYGDYRFRDPAGFTARVYTINYAAARPGQRLRVSVKLLSASAGDQSGVLLQAVSHSTLARNAPPVVRIVTPTEDATFQAAARITLEAQASDPDGPDGAISKVEFFDTSMALRLGDATAPPYRITVERPGAWQGAFCARAFDRHGRAAYSEVVHYRVDAAAETPAPREPRTRSFASNGARDHGWEAVSSMVELPNGDILAAWFAGKLELTPDTAIFSSRLPKGAKTWTASRRMIDTPGAGDVNPVLFFRDGVLWCFYGKLTGPSIEFSKLVYRQSRDFGASWGPEVAMAEPQFRYQTGTLPSTKPLALANGDILLPVNREAYDPDPAKQWFSLFLISSNGGRTWQETQPLFSFPGNIQPAVVQLKNGSLLAYFRVRGLNRFLWKATSQDNGRTWSPLVQTDIPNPSARVALARLPNGKLVLAFNNSSTRRTPLALAISEDEGQTWRASKAIETGGYAFTYPHLLVSRDGAIHLSYNDNYRAVKHATVDEAWFYEPLGSSSISSRFSWVWRLSCGKLGLPFAR